MYALYIMDTAILLYATAILALRLQIIVPLL